MSVRTFKSREKETRYSPRGGRCGKKLGFLVGASPKNVMCPDTGMGLNVCKCFECKVDRVHQGLLI